MLLTRPVQSPERVEPRVARWLHKTVEGTLNAELCARGHASYEVSRRGRFHDRQP
jgi:hypothetical protein